MEASARPSEFNQLAFPVNCALIGFACLLFACGQSADKTAMQHQQVLVVLSQDWEDAVGRAIWLERDGLDWEVVHQHDVNLGRNGMGWGEGLLHPKVKERFALEGEPVKKEGDGKSPAGCFELSFAFGNASKPPTGSRLPWVSLENVSECIDDPASDLYNQLVRDGSQTKGKWNSAEQMLRPDSLYAVGVFVDHNYATTKPELGSCIFLHIQRGAEEPTAGCTSMHEEDVRELVRWLDPKKRPLLIQYPRPVFDRIKDEFSKPDPFADWEDLQGLSLSHEALKKVKEEARLFSSLPL